MGLTVQDRHFNILISMMTPHDTRKYRSWLSLQNHQNPIHLAIGQL